MANNDDSKTSNNTNGFAVGVMLGTLLGGASLLLFGTKTGQKIKDQLSDEYSKGALDLTKLHEKTNQKLESFIKNSPFAKKLLSSIEEVTSKELATKPHVNKDKKNFFSKRGKKLG